MPAHVEITAVGGGAAPAIDISVEGGTDSDVITREIWNDRTAAFGDTTTAQDVALVLLASLAGGPLKSDGVPLLDERWGRIQITHRLTAAGATTDGATATLPLGTNATLPIGDIAPQGGVRFAFYVTAPGGRGVHATRVAFDVYDDHAAQALAPYVSIGGGGVVPPDRIPGLRSLLRGSTVTADDTDTVAITGGLQVYDGVTTAFVGEDVTFTLADAAAVDLGAGESYRVTLSRDDAAAATVTKTVKGAAAFADAPVGDVTFAHLIVSSADGVAVTVAVASVDQSMVLYAGFAVRAGTGLAAIVSPGYGMTESDASQYVSHSITVALTATATNRLWLTPSGGIAVTTTPYAPAIAAELLATVVTDAGAVTAITDERRMLHRSVTEWSLEMNGAALFAALAPPVAVTSFAVLGTDAELEAVTLDLDALGASWDAGTLRIDVRAYAPGSDATGAGTSIYTLDAQRPALAWNAASLRVTSADHITRRFVRGTRFRAFAVATVTTTGGEAEREIVVTLRFRRYR